MNKKMQWLKASFSMLILWSLLLNSVPVKAQGDIVTSEDISGGSSVFVFRKSRKAEQAKFAPRSNAKRNEAQKAKSRKLVKDQVSKVIPKRTKIEIPKPTPKPTPVTGKPTPKPTPIKTASPRDASNAIAGGAEVYLERGDVDRAVTMFKESLKLYPDNSLAKAGLSEALTQRADKIFETDGADLSIPVYEEAIKYDNKNAAAYAGLGSAYDVMENSDLTFQNYDKALSLNPNLTELYAPLGITYYQKGEIAKADELLTKAVSAKSEDDQTQFLLGLIRYKQNRNEEAIAALKSSIAITETAEAHYYLGEVYDRLKRDKEAIDEYNKAVTLNPKFAEAWFDLGVAYYNRNRFEDAINAYTQAVKMKNDNYEAHENLADVYRQIAFNSKDEAISKANYEKAEGSYQLATVLAERNPKAQADKLALSELYSKYGFVLGRLSKWSPNKWSSAITVLTKSTSLNPDSVDYTNLGWAYYNAAQIDLQNKQKDQANIKLAQGRDWLQKAVALDPKSKGALMNLGVTYTDLGDFANAIDALRKSVALDGKWVIAHNELGLAYRGAGNLDEAVKSFKRTVDLDKNFASGLYNWAETEMARGNAKEARELQKRLAKINPGLAERLNYVFADQLRNKVDGKIQEKNPLNKLPKLPF